MTGVIFRFELSNVYEEHDKKGICRMWLYHHVGIMPDLQAISCAHVYITLVIHIYSCEYSFC